MKKRFGKKHYSTWEKQGIKGIRGQTPTTNPENIPHRKRVYKLLGSN